MTVNVTETIRNRIMKYELRHPIFFEVLIRGNEDYKNAGYKAINALKKQGVIKQFTKGIYYRPKNTKYGELGLDRDLLINEKYIGKNYEKGYVTGPDIWSLWGLTTQIPKRKWIAQYVDRSYFNESLNIFIVKSKVEVSKDIVCVLQFLDVIDQLEDIPDACNEDLLNKMINIYVDQFSPLEKISVFDLAQSYTKKVQIIVGLIAETASIEDEYYKVRLSNYKKALRKSVSKRIKIKVSPVVFNGNDEWRNEYDTTRVSI